jgi:hypothetical protein
MKTIVLRVKTSKYNILLKGDLEMNRFSLQKSKYENDNNCFDSIKKDDPKLKTIVL